VLTYSGQPFIGGNRRFAGSTGGYPAATTNYYPDTAANTYTGNVTPSLGLLGIYYVKATNRNYVTAPTINLNASAKTIVKHNGAALVANDIVDGHDMFCDTTGPTCPDKSVRDPPVGSVITTFEDACPTGYIEVNGPRSAGRPIHAFSANTGQRYGPETGPPPSIFEHERPLCPRWDHSAGRDPDRASRTARGDGTAGDAVGTTQSHQYYSHNHSASTSMSANPTYTDSTIQITYEHTGTYGEYYAPPDMGESGSGAGYPYSRALSPSQAYVFSTSVSHGGTRPARSISTCLYCVKY
jgi:hypothetical protein